MTTVRLTTAQKSKLEKAAEVLRNTRGRRVSRGEAVAALAEFALRHRELLAAAAERDVRRDDDPFFDLSLTFDLGRTDEKTHDRVLYGRT